MADLTAFHVTDRDEWNAFVEHARYRSFPQLWEWGELREASGWRAVRFAVGKTRNEPLAGAQVLIRQVPLLGWRLGYAPRGPIGQFDEADTCRSFMAALRHLAAIEKLATIKVDPEATPNDALGALLHIGRWRASTKVQPPRTRVIDLSLDEEALLTGMRKKHRQYVHKAERAGVQVVQHANKALPDQSATALADFYAIYRETAKRAGFPVRAQDYYERVWSLFSPTGHARLFFATLDGARVAALFHFTCGDRAAEAYGGMTDAGADSHANYLLKREAIRAFKTEGFATYDLWGIATGGIAQFKEGFGGEQIDYIGARDLPLRPIQDAALRVLLPAYAVAQRARLRLTGHKLSGSDD